MTSRRLQSSLPPRNMNEASPSLFPPQADAVRRYLAALDEGNVDDLLACFSEQALYVHAGSGPEPRRQTLRGAAELRDFFTARGHKPWSHRVDACAWTQGQCLMHGALLAQGGEPFGAFMACASIDADGRIAHYRAFVGWGEPSLNAYFAGLSR